MEAILQIVGNLKLYSFAQNTAFDYLVAFFVFLLLLFVLKIFQIVILVRLKKLAKKTKTDFDDVVISVFTHLKPPFYSLISLYFSVKTLTLPKLAADVLYIAFIIVIVYEVIQAAQKLIDYFFLKYAARSSKESGADEHAQSMVKTLGVVVKIFLWILGILVILSNLGVNVTSLVASLGIGGIAVALALQNVLSDMFSSFSIYIDKPFQVGDYIVIGEDKGVVEKIGLKSTRIRTLQGEELVISNNELTSTRIQNYKKMKKRRVVFTLGVTYSTPADVLAKIPKIIKEIIANEKKLKFDRCHFKEYADSSLNFEIVYYVDGPDYLANMNLRQKVNMAIYKQFAKEKIEFAFPTQTLYVEKSS